jgi:hypothetical protein
MALNNYENLKKSIINWSHRDDLNLLVPDFIELAEAEMFANDEEILEVKNTGKNVELVLVNGEVELPSDLLDIRSIKIKQSEYLNDISFKTPQGIDYDSHYTVASQYTIIDNMIKTNANSSETIRLDYISQPVSLDEINNVNEVLINHPQIYLFGALWALFSHTQEIEDAQNYYVKFIKAIRGANKKAKKGKYPSGLQMRHNKKGRF